MLARNTKTALIPKYEGVKKMKYTKAQLNAISRNYTRIAQQKRREELKKLKTNDPKMFEYFLKSKYKTLLWFNRFLAKFDDINEAFKQIEKQNKRGVNNEF